MIIVIMGVTASGKTTIGTRASKRFGWHLYDADEFHPPENIAKMSSGEPLTDAELRGSGFAESIHGVGVHTIGIQLTRDEVAGAHPAEVHVLSKADPRAGRAGARRQHLHPLERIADASG